MNPKEDYKVFILLQASIWATCVKQQQRSLSHTHILNIFILMPFEIL